MGVITTLTIEWRVHSDGCTILAWEGGSPLIRIDGSERYPAGTEIARALRSLAAYCAAVDRGERDSESLWLELELPFE